MSEIRALTDLLHLIRDDSYSITFQSTGQYRTALINEVRRKIRCLESEAVTGNENPKLHYYTFCFSAGYEQASLYIGWPDFPVTLAKINEARDRAGIAKPSVLMGCSYLGHMTPNEMTGVTHEYV